MVRVRITGPLKMRDTSVSLNASQKRRFVQGYDLLRNKAKPWDFPGSQAAAGGIRSTIRDMRKYLLANIDADDSTPLGRAMILSREKGLGWDSAPNADFTWKNGETGGFSTVLVFNAKAKIGYVQLANQASNLSFELGFAIQSPPFVIPAIAEYEVTPSVMAEETGKYVVHGTADECMTVAKSGAHLAIVDPGHQMRLYAKSDLSFDAYDGEHFVGYLGVDFVAQGSEITGVTIHLPAVNGSPTQDISCDRATP